MSKEKDKQEQSEPVAWMCQKDNGHFDVLTDQTCKKCFPVYTTPQQRTWVGLTDADIEKAYEQAEKKEPYMGAVTRKGIAEAFEQILKEKNT